MISAATVIALIGLDFFIGHFSCAAMVALFTTTLQWYWVEELMKTKDSEIKKLQDEIGAITMRLNRLQPETGIIEK
jgi:hypothetical protein